MNVPDPWAAPAAVPLALPKATRRPAVVAWFAIDCGALVLICSLVGLATSAITVKLLLHAPPRGTDPDDAFLIRGLEVVGSALYLGLATAFGAALWLPRRPWVWTYDFVLIGLGLLGGPLILASVPLLIFWQRPHTKRYFGRPNG